MPGGFSTHSLSHLYSLETLCSNSTATGHKVELWTKQRGGRDQCKGGINLTHIPKYHLIRVGGVYKYTLYVQSIEGELALWTHAISLQLQRQSSLFSCHITVSHPRAMAAGVGMEEHCDLNLGARPDLTFPRRGRERKDS